MPDEWARVLSGLGEVYLEHTECDLPSNRAIAVECYTVIVESYTVKQADPDAWADA